MNKEIEKRSFGKRCKHAPPGGERINWGSVTVPPAVPGWRHNRLAGQRSVSERFGFAETHADETQIAATLQPTAKRRSYSGEATSFFAADQSRTPR